MIHKERSMKYVYHNRVMIRFICTFCLLTFLDLTGICCQPVKVDMTPVELAQRIFDKNGFSDINKYITGEYKGHPNGKEIIPKGANRKFTLLSQTNQNAVVALTITDKAGLGKDYYLYFVKESVWKMQAFRSLAMTGFGLFEKNQLERLNAQQIDSIIATSQQSQLGHSLFSSRQEYDFKLGNARLLTLSDEGLITFFNAHRHQFEELKDVILAGKKELEENKTVNKELTIKNQRMLESSWKEVYQKLFITYVPASDYDFKSSVELVVWGMVDNSVGYVYIPDQRHIPTMSPDHIIMLRAIDGGWFLYKTT